MALPHRTTASRRRPGSPSTRPCWRATPATPTRPGAPTLRLYTYRSHCALVGRYQHLDAEVDLDACRRTGTGFSRRPTGGGAIVMGAGQLGVAVATRAPADQNPRALLGRYAEGIVAGLAELGIEATFAGKNDLSVDGRKIAGLGLYLEPGRRAAVPLQHPGRPRHPVHARGPQHPGGKLGDKAVAAVAERITTVSRETGRTVGGADIREVIATGFAKALGVELSPGDDDPGRGSPGGGARSRALRQRGVVQRAQPPTRRHRHLGVQDAGGPGALLPRPARPDDQERPVHRRLQRRSRAAGPLRGVAALGPPRGGLAGEAGRRRPAPTAPASACRRRSS